MRDDGFGPREEQRIRERMKERLGSLRLDLEFTERIPMTTTGKWKYLIQDLAEGRSDEPTP